MGRTGISCAPRPLMLSPTVDGPDTQIAESVSFLDATPRLSGMFNLEYFDAFTYIHSSTFRSAVYPTRSRVTLDGGERAGVWRRQTEEGNMGVHEILKQ